MSKRAPKSAHRFTAHGFTLLEVLISLAILASALTVLLGTMANSGQQAVFANELTMASMLARSKMIDIEYELMEEGFSTGGQRFNGDFGDEGRPDITWEAVVNPVEIPETSKEQFLAQVNSQLFGDQSQGALDGNAAFSAMLPMLIGQLPEMINTIGAKVRRIQLRVEFEYGGKKFPIEIVEYAADPNLREFGLFGDTGADAPQEISEDDE